MTIERLRLSISATIFSNVQVRRLFPEESTHTVYTQLSRWSAQGKLVRLKRGIYHFAERPIDEFNLGGLLYKPSYISLETALNVYSMLPDVSQQITSINPITTRSFQTQYGIYSYTKIKKELFFGFGSEGSGLQLYQLAYPEKAILDYIYLRKIENFTNTRLDIPSSIIRSRRLKIYLSQFPDWVTKIIKEII